MGADLDPFFRHDEGPIQQREIPDGAAAVRADGKRAATVDRDVIAEDDGSRRLAFEMAEYLGAFAIETVAENDVGRDRFLPPIAFDPPLIVDVAHPG